MGLVGFAPLGSVPLGFAPVGLRQRKDVAAYLVLLQLVPDELERFQV